MAPTTLLSLPPELQLMIAEHLAPLPLRSLSQSSAQLRSLLTCVVFARTRTDALLHFAVTNNHPLLLRIALYRGARLDPLTPENQYLSRETWAAVKYDNVLLTMRLNASLDQCVERYALGALHRAAHAGHAEIVDVLLDAGADAGARTSRRDTALHVAAEAGQVGVVARLLQRGGVDVDGRGWKGCTALHYAAMRGDVGVASVLVEMGAGVDVRNGNGATPLHLAAWRGMEEVVEFLLVVGAGVGVLDADGAAPVHLAAAAGAERVVEVLLAAGAEKGGRDGKGWTPYDCAWRAGHGDMARRLLRTKGANWRLLENLIRVVRR